MILLASSHTSEWVPSFGVQWNFTSVAWPSALTKRKVCTPKPCIIRKLRGMVRSLICHSSMWVDSGVSDTKSQKVSCALAPCGIS
jgi:hypothetical protein